LVSCYNTCNSQHSMDAIISMTSNDMLQFHDSVCVLFSPRMKFLYSIQRPSTGPKMQVDPTTNYLTINFLNFLLHFSKPSNYISFANRPFFRIFSLVEFLHSILHPNNISTNYFSSLFPIFEKMERWHRGNV